MSLNVQVNEVDTRLSTEASGQYAIADLSNLLDRASEEVEKHRYR